MSVSVREKNKGSGVWWIFINHAGQRRSKQIGPKAEAVKLADIIRGKIASGDMGVLENKEQVKPFSYYAAIWRDTILPATCKPSTITSYHSLLKKHVSSAPFWSKPIDQITQGEIEEYLLSKRTTLTHYSVSSILKVVSGVLNVAKKRKVISANVGLNIKVPKEQGKQPRKRPAPLNEQQVEILLNHFKDRQYYELVLFLARVGCRAGEAAALKWSDLDLTNRKVTIRRTIHLGIESSTKNGKERKVDLTPMVVAALKKLKLRSQKNTEYVFQTKSGTPVDMGNFRSRVFYTALKELGLPIVRIHDLRHSCATFLIRRTKDIFYAQKQLGHSSIQITCDRYGHLLEDDSETRLIDILDEAVAQ